MALPPFSAARCLAALAAWLMLAAAPARAGEIQDIDRLYRDGDLAGALSRADAYLAGHPRDAQARFLKGLILGRQGRTGEAIGVFTALTEDYPELPEPYNNLAVLHASQSRWEDARLALEAAVRAHPGYATAHENLGDLNAKMAALAYAKAAALDDKNTTARTKQTLIQNMLGTPPAQPVPPAP
jgi:Flp pilus assembly protein TadD